MRLWRSGKISLSFCRVLMLLTRPDAIIILQFVELAFASQLLSTQHCWQ